jgi:hypothetical protein
MGLFYCDVKQTKCFTLASQVVEDAPRSRIQTICDTFICFSGSELCDMHREFSSGSTAVPAWNDANGNSLSLST